MKNSLRYAAALIIAAAPVAVLAATSQTLGTVIQTIIAYLNIVLVLLMALAIVMFTWYVIKYYVMFNEDRKEGNTYVMYSLIGFFVILSFWGLVNILQNSFGLQNSGNKPGDWASFTSIFPGSGAGTYSGSAANDGNGFDQNIHFGVGQQ